MGWDQLNSKQLTFLSLSSEILTVNSTSELQGTSALPYKYFNRELHPSNTSTKETVNWIPSYTSVFCSHGPVWEHWRLRKSNAAEQSSCSNQTLCVFLINIPVLSAATLVTSPVCRRPCSNGLTIASFHVCGAQTSHQQRFPCIGEAAEPGILLLSLPSSAGDGANSCRVTTVPHVSGRYP